MGKYSNYQPVRVRLHVVALKAFLLGVVLTASLGVMLFIRDSNTLLFRVALYTLLNSIFHLLEFFMTALCNTLEVDDDSFILNDIELYIVYIASILEGALKTIDWTYSIKLRTSFLVAGLSIIILGQICRSLAMYTAGVSFHHYIQKEASDKRPLVHWGIYKYMRHPSYFGYFWWFVGGQIMLQNPVLCVVGIYKLHQFFKNRISYEEEFLVAFYGKQYEIYRENTPTRIPYIK